MSTTKAVIDALYDLAQLYPRYQLPDDTAALYAKNLADLPLPAVLMAIDRCGKTGTFFPALAEIRKQVAEQAANPAEIAESAWTIVKREIARTGQYRTPVFDSPLIAQVIESVGWKTLCTMDIDDAYERFLFGYRSFRKRAVSQIQTGDFSEAGDSALDASNLRALPDRKAS